MATTVKELIEKLEALPPNWAVRATKSGRSVEAWEQGGRKYAQVFTDEAPTRYLTSQFDASALDPKQKEATSG